MKLRHTAWSIPVVLGAGILTWVLAFRDGRSGTHSDGAAPRAAAPPANGREEQRLARALELARALAQSRERLVELYGEGTGDPSALPARKLALLALFNQENVPTRLSSVLAAVEADPTSPTHDPLWQDIVGKLAETWRGETLTRGLDLMLAESRPRAKRAIIASFAAIASSERLTELTPEQRGTLGNHFIDLYSGLPDDQKPEVEAAVRRALNDDVADILRGKGLKADNELAIQRAYNQALENAPKAVAQAPQQGGTVLEPSKDYRGE